MTIISHKHRLIHLHNQKSAGTSFEVALSKYCGPDDVITPENELFRRQQNFMTARNYKDKGYYFRFERQNFKRLLINFRTFYRSVLYKLGVASAFESFV
ncbi:MAG: hypothetical protein J4F41_02685 [Alphaproteobacteria bacterium]|nr:hypothetical protein [Alphaproteobacteria bacterium]